ncbi:YidC family membrane integrase SpoIIIJ [Bacillus sp. AFS041924]|uniref:YidC family membrane integrase SpoIIIJ n=1 Tax=Bacillus sp. AFS041924 TaxID=2033503 RepID=UPI000BFC648E|nr:YidC family membrane integrase SpoIIIJ [Bacillus sp. AFS041924]PGS54478.1 OxaA precursor [Bacillus sp. AFS041924]
MLVTVLFLVVVLAGCSQTNQPITSESTGIWNEYFVYPLSWLITAVSEIFGGSYGMGIIIVTILIRLALLPLMIKQIKSTKAMQSIQPEMLKLREKYSSKDQKTVQKLNEETMKLYQQHGVNPLSGCLPIFIQMPILIAFYHAIMRTMEIKAHDFLWFQLGHPDPIYALPIIAGLTTFIQQKVSMNTGTMTGPAAQQMKIMLYVMPIMILVFAVKLPSALALYWGVGNTFMIIQTLLVNRGNNTEQNNSVGGASK